MYIRRPPVFWLALSWELWNSLEFLPKPTTRDLLISERHWGGSEILKIEGFFFPSSLGFLNFFETHNRRFSTNSKNCPALELPTSIDLHPVFKWDPSAAVDPLCGSLVLTESTSKVLNEDMDVSSAYWSPIPSLSKEARVSRSTTEHISISDSLVAFGMWTQVVELGLGIPRVSKIAQILPLNF